MPFLEFRLNLLLLRNRFQVYLGYLSYRLNLPLTICSYGKVVLLLLQGYRILHLKGTLKVV